MNLSDKLEILADAAKYDASCASSGAPKRSSQNKAGLGATTGMGICHSYTPDGRCVSLLKILLTNFCQYDCQYCVNRRTSNVPRARFSVEEVVRLTVDFYRRNYIEGLFLSSGIIRSSNYTMEQLVEVARQLREVEQFRGYIHLKTIPDADPELIALAGHYADRLSVNIELPTEAGIVALAPEKSTRTIKLAMATIRHRLDEASERPASDGPAARTATAAAPRGDSDGAEAQAISAAVAGSSAVGAAVCAPALRPARRARGAARHAPPRFAPAGQSTQMIVGADAADDRTILDTAQTLYGAYRLKRVYYSAFSPIPDSPGTVPLAAPPLQREHRLYQADFLLRGYGFQVDELFASEGDLPLDIDPKLAWALANRHRFPLDLNRADAALIARVPGIGLRNAGRIVALRRQRRVHWADLARLRCSMTKLAAFVEVADYRPRAEPESATLQRALARPAQQLGLWQDAAEPAVALA